MAQQPRSPHDLHTQFDHQLGQQLGHQFDLLPALYSAHLASEPQSQSADPPATVPRERIRAHAIRQVVVLKVAGRLSEVVEDLDLAIQLALASGPRGVACDLSAALEVDEPGAVDVLANAGRHVRDWSGVPVAVACPDPQVRHALSTHLLGGQLIVTESILPAVSQVLAAPTPVVNWRRLAPHPTAPRASRDFVARTLLDWRLSRVIPAASLVVSELVANSATHAGTDIDLSVAWHLGALRLMVRDDSPDLPRQRHPHLDLHGRGLTMVSRLSRAFGALPTADGGKVVWAVLNAPQSRSSTSPRAAVPTAANPESPMFNDARGLAGLPFCARSTPQPAEGSL